MSHITPRRFAEIAKRAIDIREGSWDAKDTIYKKTRSDSVLQAIKELNAEPIWYQPINLFIFDGYAESADWIEGQLKIPEHQDLIDLYKRGKQITAISQYRIRTGCSLKTAHEFLRNS